MARTNKPIGDRCPECGRSELFEDVHTDEIKCGNCKASWTNPEFYGEEGRDTLGADDENDRGDGLASLNRD